MAIDWNGDTLAKNEEPETPTTTPEAGETPTDTTDWEGFYERLKQTQRITARDEANRDLMRFAASPECREDDATFKYLDDYAEKAYGIRPERGNLWNADGRQPFASARKYANTMVMLMKRGYTSICAPEDRQWLEAKASGDREAMMKIAGVARERFVQTGSTNGYGTPIGTVTATDEEIDEQLEDYNAKVLGHYASLMIEAFDRQFTMTDDERKMILASVGGDGLPEEYQEAYRKIAATDVKRAAHINQLIKQVARRERAPFMDGLKDIGRQAWSTVSGIATEAKEDWEKDKLEREYRETVSAAPEAYYWNQKERDYFRALNLTGEDPRAREKTDWMCARRLAEEAKPRAQRIRERHERLLLEDATRHVPYDNYGFVYNSVVGAVGTLPYMAMTAIPYVGLPLTVLNQFGNMRDEIITNGGDPDEAVGLQLALATTWGLIEKIEPKVLFGKPMTALNLKMRAMRVAETAWKNGKAKRLGQLAAAVAPEALASETINVVQEGLQGAVEEGEKEYFTSHDWRKTFDAASKGFKDELVGSIGSMGILTAVGVGIKAYKAKKRAADTASLLDYTAKRLQIMNMMQGKVVNPDENVEGEAPSKAVAKMRDDIHDIWRRHMEDNTGGSAAIDEIAEKYHLNEEESRQLTDYLDLREALLAQAEQSVDAQEKDMLKRIAGNALVIGGSYDGVGDTVRDVEKFFAKAFPNAKVEMADIVTGEKPSAELQAAIAERDAAQKKVDDAKVGSARRGAERELRRAQRRVKAAERKGNDKTTEKRLKVTFPMGEDGKTQSVYVDFKNEGWNIHSAGFANSVALAVQGAEGLDDGEAMTLDEFKVMPTEAKLNVAVTSEQYTKGMNDDERQLYLAANGLTSGGNFSFTGEDGKPLFDTDGVIWLSNLNGDGSHRGGNYTLAHEAGHATIRLARNLGLIIPESPVTKTMVKLFGEARAGMDELWNEEKMSDMFRDYLRDKLDYKRLTPEERRQALPLFKRMWDTIKCMATLSGTKVDSPRDRSERERAMDAVFEAMRNGDFAGLDQFAGLDLAEEKPTDETPTPAAPTETAPKPAENAPQAQGMSPSGPSVTRAPKASKTASKPIAPKANVPEDENSAYQAGFQAALAQMAADPANFAAQQPVRTGKKRTLKTPDRTMQVEYEWVWFSAADNKPAFGDYQDRKSRLTDDASNDVQTLKMSRPRRKTNNGREEGFDAEAMLGSAETDRGAPIVVGGGLPLIAVLPESEREEVVDMTASGNGRMLTINKLIEEGRFDEYLNPALAFARENGIPLPPEDMEHPILKRRIVGGESLKTRQDLVDFCRKSNGTAIKEHSNVENATNTVDILDDNLFRLFNPGSDGDLLAVSNRPFMNAYLNAIQKAGIDISGLRNSDLTPTMEASTRVERSLIAKVFGNDMKAVHLVSYLLEKSRALSLGRLRDALISNAARLFSMKQRRGLFDIVDDVREAAYQYITWRVASKSSPGLTLADHLNQRDFYADETPPMQQALAKLLETGRFGATLEKYAELVAQEAEDDQGMLGIVERHTPLQLIGYAERALLSEEEKESAVTPDPESAEAKAPVQTPPTVAVAPEPAPTAAEAKPEASPVEQAQEILAPTEPETFIPAPYRPGTATLPSPDAEKVYGYRVGADGNPSTEKKLLPPGAYNLLRAPYDVRRPPAPSAQDKAGRGLGIANPPPTGHADIFPHFQGNKTEMAARTSQAIRKLMTKAEREHYETVVDYFGGGGCWGLYHALENFPNARLLVINEWDGGRIAKIRLLQEIDGEVADRAKAIIDTFVEELRKACEVAKDGGESGSSKTIANKLEPFLRSYEGDDLGVLTAFYDCASSMFGNNFDETGNASFDLGMEKIYNTLREDGRKAKKAADEFKARGGKIQYRQGDAAYYPDAPKGDKVVAVCDPPYYLTAGYNGQVSVPIDAKGAGWGYLTTARMLKDLVDNGDAIVYTDEAWWNKDSYSPNPNLGDDLFGNKSDFDQEQGVLLDIINTLDHFDVAGRVVGRQEVLGIHHGHDTESESGAGIPDNGDAAAGNGNDERGDTDGKRHSVRRMARGAEDETRFLRAAGARGGRESGRRALAREVIVQDIAAAIDAATGEMSPQAADMVARATVAVVRPDRLADYCQFVKDNADAWKRADMPLYDGALPVPIEMRADQSLADVRYSVQMGNRAKEEARAMIAKYRPELSLGQDWKTVGEQRILDGYVDTIAAFDTPKERKAALYWFCKSTIRLPEDSPKVVEAIKTAERAKVDPFQFERPGEILEKYAEFRPVEPPINPDTVPELSDRRDMGNGIVTYLVQDDQAGQAAMRKIINTHFGKDASPWCLLQGDGNGGLSDSAWHYWQQYSALPKRVAFKDGKLVAFMATDKGKNLDSLSLRQQYMFADDYEADVGKSPYDEFGNYTEDFKAWIEIQEWWDRADEPHDGIPFTRSVPSPSGEGANATEHVEMRPDGTIWVFKTTRGDPNAKVGRYEEWFPSGKYKFREDGEGRDHHFELWVEGIEQEHSERHNNMTLEILKSPDGSILDARVESEEMANPFRMRYGKYHNELVIRKGYDEAFIHEGTQISADDFVEIAKSLYDALKRNDNDEVDAIVSKIKAMVTSATPRFSVHSAWRGDFPKAVAHTTRKNIMEKYGDLFRKAKSGDMEAAADLIEKVVKPEKIRALVAEHPNASIVVPVYAEEATGRNQLPRQFATYISALTGIESDTEILQRVRAFHTGANAEHRLFVQPEFDGPVKRGAEYIIVDDHITQGSTVNALRDHIESNGGKVVAVSALTLSQGSSILSPRKETIDETRRKWPDIDGLLRKADIADRAESLTESQLRYINQFSPDGFRTRIAEEVKQRIARVRNETLGAPSEGVARAETQAERAAMRHSVFVGAKAATRKAVAIEPLTEAAMMLQARYNGKYTDEARDEIYATTGWWKGTDGLWRFEIRDMKPKKRGDSTISMTNGLCAYGDSAARWCYLTEMVSHTTLFKAYPQLKDVVVAIVDPDSMKCTASYNPNRNRITLNWDAVDLFDDEPSNQLRRNGLSSLTHEVQHAVQELENFGRGGSVENVGSFSEYQALAGEVEARNAEIRRGMRHMLPNAFKPRRGETDESFRRRLTTDGKAPWQTEDIETGLQLLYTTDGNDIAPRAWFDAHPEYKGNRHDMRRGTPMRREDIATAAIAARRLAGKEVKVEDADKLLKNLGVKNLAAADLVAAADRLAEKNRERLKGNIERSDPQLLAALAKESMSDRYRDALSSAITGGAAAADPEIGMRLQRAIQSKETRDLMAANGFDAAQMMAELPISLADAVFAVAEYEKSPEEAARLAAAKQQREEERALEQAEADALGLTLDEYREQKAREEIENTTYREPTDEERARLDALLDRARFAEEARKAEEDRKKLEKKRKAEAAAAENDEDGVAPDDASSGDDSAGDDLPDIPTDTLRRIAPVFESADLFASFIVEWTADHVVDKHPNIPNTAEMWKNPVAVRELKQTATHILRQLAKDVLGSPSLNYSRNFADHAINELESDAECKTFSAVRRKISRIYDQIHDNALALSRRQMVGRLIREIRKAAVERGRFSAVKEDLKRKIDAKTEQWCRWLIPALTMSEEKLATEIARLTDLVTVRPADPNAEDDASPSSLTDDKLREAADRLAILQKYGGMSRWMPGRIADAETEIMEQINGKRAEFEQRREEAAQRDEAVRSAIIAAVEAGATDSFRKHSKLGDAFDRYTASMMGNLTLEMQNLIRYCADPAKRQAALEAIEEIQSWISEGTSTYRVVLGEAQAELRQGLALCYGDATTGIRHLRSEQIPVEAATAIFKRRDRLPTFGNLLQLYASSIQADYKNNADLHGRTEQIELMKSTLTEADLRFHAWAVEWYRRNRQRLSESVEAVTGLPVTAPDAFYTPVRVERDKDGFDAEGMGWSPVPSALNRRVAHQLDFNEGANFLACLQEQAEVRAQTIGYAEFGIRLRDTIAHRDVQAAVRKNVGKKDMKIVTDHIRDVLVQNAAKKDENAFWSTLNVARRWMARFYLSGNIPSAVKQLASMPVWANALLGGREIGLNRCLRYLTSVGTDEGRAALRELMASDGFKARYTMGWSEETQNVLLNPSANAFARFIERAFDKGMIVNKSVDAVSCLWMAQGFYRDATQTFVDNGLAVDEAKRKAMALTWSVLESGQQSGRVENMNTLQRRGGSAVAAIFQFKTAYLLQNNYLFQAIREMRAGTPGARGRFLRALFINTVWIPGFVACVNAVWNAIMGEPEPPEDESQWPLWLKTMAWSMIEGVTAPMFGLNTAMHSVYDAMTNERKLNDDNSIPAIGGAVRIVKHAGSVIYDLGRFGLQQFTALDFEDELTAEKLGKDVNRLVKDLCAPYRHGAKAIENRMENNE